MVDNNRLVVAIYSRKSKYTGKGDSVENQIEICRDYIRIHFPDYEIEYLIYEDEGYSGCNMKRPGMNALLSYAKKYCIDVFICYRLDRVSRSVADFSDFIEELGHMKIKFISVRENFDTTTPMGRAMLHIASVFAQLERETIAERITDSLHGLAKLGYWLGGEPPTGYKSERVEYLENDKKRSYYKLVIKEDEAELVKLIYDQYEMTGSYNALANKLKAMKVHTKNGSVFGNYSLKYILTNPVYAVADHNIYEFLKDKGYGIYSEKNDFDGKYGLISYSKNDEHVEARNRRKDFCRWIVVVGFHKGIISSKQWINTQKMIEKRSKQVHS